MPAPGRSNMSGRSSLTPTSPSFKDGLKGVDAVGIFMPLGVAVELRRPDGEPLLQGRGRAAACRRRRACARSTRPSSPPASSVQIDDPRLVMNYMLNSADERGRCAQMGAKARIAALNHALRRRHSRRPHPSPHLLRHQHGSAHQRLRAEEPRRPDRHHQCRITTRSRWPIRATSTNGRCGRTSSCRTTRC